MQLEQTFKNGQWLSYTNNSCRFDEFMTLYLLIFKNYIISNKNLKVYFEINEIVKALDEVILNLLNDINSPSRYEFWSLINNILIDRGFTENYLGSMGYISGLFSIFREDEDFCLKIKESSICILCNDTTSRTYYGNPLIRIYKQDLNTTSLLSLIKLKYLPSAKTCKCVSDANLICKNYKFEVVNF